MGECVCVVVFWAMPGVVVVVRSCVSRGVSWQSRAIALEACVACRNNPNPRIV